MTVSTAYAVVHVQTVGNEGTPVLVIDNVVADAVALTKHARDARETVERSYYPGARVAAPAQYSQPMLLLIARLLAHYYQVPAGYRATCRLVCLSQVSTPPAQLAPLQCLPHFDSAEPFYFAGLHCLSSGSYGGTSFYRHDGTNTETVVQARLAEYEAQVAIEAKRIGAPRYLRRSGNGFTRIGTVRYRQHRLILYPGNLLHSGDIDPARDLVAAFGDGRLTGNFFVKWESPADNGATPGSAP